ncbi:DUF308 domain-containing protein [Elizabethkingia meningoseptica]|uniref:DUF308 domain-containing protein n=1 Tax=Elizabethkingia meningoseptica TaxID=238 RepID=UPI0038929341
MPAISGIYTIITGLFIFITRPIAYPTLGILTGSVFILAGLISIVFTIRNRKLINGWGLYMLYGILILDLGLYLSFYAGDSLFFVLWMGSLLRSGIYLGTSLELKKHEHPKWSYLAITGGLGMLLSLILITNSFNSISPYTIASVCFIIMGISAVLLSLEFKKFNRFHRIIRKLSKL